MYLKPETNIFLLKDKKSVINFLVCHKKTTRLKSWTHMSLWKTKQKMTDCKSAWIRPSGYSHSQSEWKLTYQFIIHSLINSIHSHSHTHSPVCNPEYVTCRVILLFYTSFFSLLLTLPIIVMLLLLLLLLLLLFLIIFLRKHY